jgi:hypothetical protein
MLNIGSLDGIWAGVNYRALPGKAKEAADYMCRRFPDFPFLSANSGAAGSRTSVNPSIIAIRKKS